MGKSMVSSVNSHTNATRIGWHLWEIDLRFASGLPPGWRSANPCPQISVRYKVGRNIVTSGGPLTVTVTEPIPCYRRDPGPLRAYSLCAWPQTSVRYTIITFV